MNILDYIDYYGSYTFEEKEFNEIDNLIFALLSYVEFSKIVDKKEISISDASDKFFLMYDEENINKNILEIRQSINLLKKISKSNRFKDIMMLNYSYIGNDASQFSAVSFKINSKLYYVSFEGTDHLMSGWEENCKMSYRFPVRAQVYAKQYLNKHFSLKRCKIIVGGHSKGGNLALVSAMYSNPLVKRKIVKVYNNDGQGLRLAQLESSQYKSIKDRLVHIIPNYSIVGLILRHDKDYVVVKSDKKGILAHDALTWQVSYDHFEKDKLSRTSRVFEEGFETWLDKYDDEKRKLFVEEAFKVIYENNIIDLKEVKFKKELLLNIIKSSKNIDPLVKEMAMELFKILVKTNLEYPWF